jgi:aminoglycoside 6'-N-acetyltransferase I
LGCLTGNVKFIEGWYARPEYRRKCIGQALVERAEGWVQAKGCREKGSGPTEKYPDSPSAHMALGCEEAGTLLNFRKILTR